jgi:hypothetical protein
MRDPKTWAMGGTVPVIAALLVAHAASPARAAPTSEPPVGDSTVAEQLFVQGKALLKAGDWPGACAKFQASMDLDAAVGTLLKLAKCREHEGKFARAFADYQAALALNRRKPGQTEARRAELEAFTTRALEALRPAVPRLRIVVRDRPPGLRVTRDGQPLPAAALDEELPVDPGLVEIRAEAPGYATVRRTEAAVAGRVTEVALALVPTAAASASPPPTLIGLEPGAAESPPAPGAPPWPPPPSLVPVPPRQAPPGVSPSPREVRLAVGASILAAGAVAGGVAAGYGIDTVSKVNASAMSCDASNRCLQPGIDLRAQAGDAQTRAFISLGIGAALIAAGIALVVTALPPRSGAPKVASSPPALVW